jgi:hypothetical protein
LFVQGVKRLSFSDRLKQNAADAKKRRCDAKGSSASSRLKPFNEQDIAIAMSHATSATFAEQGITHMQFAWAVASKMRIADTTLSVKRFQYHEQWAKMVCYCVSIVRAYSQYIDMFRVPDHFFLANRCA